MYADAEARAGRQRRLRIHFDAYARDSTHASDASSGTAREAEARLWCGTARTVRATGVIVALRNFEQLENATGGEDLLGPSPCGHTPLTILQR